MKTDILNDLLHVDKASKLLSDIEENTNTIKQILARAADEIERLRTELHNKTFAFKDIDEFEEIVGYKCNDVFKDGWRMARTTNKQIGIMNL